jgi:ATP-dependent DNA ligase
VFPDISRRDYAARRSVMGVVPTPRALPFPLPIHPMLAKAEDELPKGAGWVYEPKWDGFRAVMARTSDGVQLWSRQGKRLDDYFPELVAALHHEFLPGTVIDGEIVVIQDNALDFESLLARMSRRRKDSPTPPPATLVAFDLIVDSWVDIRTRPLRERRLRLETLIGSSGWVVLTPQTDDVEAARGWYLEFGPRGFEGVVAKDSGKSYRGGSRGWQKIRWRRTCECVVGGYTKGRLLLGMFEGSTLHYVGATTSIRRWAPVAAVLKALPDGKSFVDGVTPAMGRFEQQRLEAWSEVEPRMVVEVAYDQVTHGRFRHDVRFVRWRPDKEPSECLREDIRHPASGVLGVE